MFRDYSLIVLSLSFRTGSIFYFSISKYIYVNVNVQNKRSHISQGDCLSTNINSLHLKANPQAIITTED